MFYSRIQSNNTKPITKLKIINSNTYEHYPLQKYTEIINKENSLSAYALCYTYSIMEIILEDRPQIIKIALVLLHIMSTPQ